MIGDWIVDSKVDMNKSQSESKRWKIKISEKKTETANLWGWNGKQTDTATAGGNSPVSH